jgi:osmotically-inducible protein OsmY
MSDQTLQKREATKAAERVRGVVEVDNQLGVQIMTDQRRADAGLRGDVLQALMLDAMVPTGVDASVREGIVTLDGAVEQQSARRSQVRGRKHSWCRGDREPDPN